MSSHFGQAYFLPTGSGEFNSARRAVSAAAISGFNSRVRAAIVCSTLTSRPFTLLVPKSSGNFRRMSSRIMTRRPSIQSFTVILSPSVKVWFRPKCAYPCVLFPGRATRQTIATIYKFFDCELQSITLHATCSLAFYQALFLSHCGTVTCTEDLGGRVKALPPKKACLVWFGQIRHLPTA